MSRIKIFVHQHSAGSINNSGSVDIAAIRRRGL